MTRNLSFPSSDSALPSSYTCSWPSGAQLVRRPAIFMTLTDLFGTGIRLELIVWLVPSLISGAVAISLTGFFMGPIYPIVMNETARILPRWLLTGSISWIAAFGTTGAAALPFIAGALAQEKGIWTLQPLCVTPNELSLIYLVCNDAATRLLAMTAVMVSLWLIIPKERVSDRAE